MEKMELWEFSRDKVYFINCQLATREELDKVAKAFDAVGLKALTMRGVVRVNVENVFTPEDFEKISSSTEYANWYASECKKNKIFKSHGPEDIVAFMRREPASVRKILKGEN